MARCLREPRRALHARIAETLESQFAEIAENQPELLARHCTEAGLIEKAAGLWGKAGQRSLERSALVEAVEQLTRALDQIATLPAHASAASRADQASGRAPNATDARQRAMRRRKPKRRSSEARSLIEQAEALGEPPEDPLLLFSVLYGFWVANYVAFNGDAVRELAAQFLSARREAKGDRPAHGWASPDGYFLVQRPETLLKAGAHFDQAIALYDPAEASSAGDAIWSRRRRGNLVLSVVDRVGAWLSRGRARRRRACASRMRARLATPPH